MSNSPWQIAILLGGLVAIVYFIRIYRRSKRVEPTLIPNRASLKSTLKQEVHFYNQLNGQAQTVFEDRVFYFLERIKVTPISDVALTMTDRILVGAAAVIPLFKFKNWFYSNLNEVLIYPDSFNESFELKGSDRNVVGMVGDGAMNRTMILSLHYLRAGFLGNTQGNTGIHEFVHLIDKSDGATDGIPEVLFPKELIEPWAKIMHAYIQEIRANEIMDINPYGATNEAEFFAVVSEYFFKHPETLDENHPELFAILEKAFGNINFKEL